VARVDYTGQADAYRRSRTLPPAVLARWQAAVHVAGLPRPTTVLDLGAGPGGFLDPLTSWFGSPVVAVEPSGAMRAEALATGVAERHPYAAAWAEALPLATASIDLAWLSTVWHQFDDQAAATRELHRVLRPAGHALVRGFFSDVPVTGFLAQFPGHERAAATFPSTSRTSSCFADAGFALARVDDVREPWMFRVPAWVERVRQLRHTDSALRPLTDDEIERGIEAVTSRYGGAPDEVASEITIRLLVFRRSP
jgi:SAM-dependent methyltransferase